MLAKLELIILILKYVIAWMSNNKENFKKNLTGIDFYFYLCRDVFKKNLNIMKDDNITLPE